jgi:hypothetical protein
MTYMIFIERHGEAPNWISLDPEAAKSCINEICDEARASDPIQTVEFATDVGDMGSNVRDNVIRVCVFRGDVVQPQPVSVVTSYQLP